MSEILLLTISTAELTKRGILGKVAKIYDLLGLASPVTLSGKMLFKDACDTKFAWDSPLPSDLQAGGGRPEKIYSDNGKTFVGAEKWLKQVMRDEKTQDYLAHENIK